MKFLFFPPIINYCYKLLSTYIQSRMPLLKKQMVWKKRLREQLIAQTYPLRYKMQPCPKVVFLSPCKPPSHQWVSSVLQQLFNWLKSAEKKGACQEARKGLHLAQSMLWVSPPLTSLHNFCPSLFCPPLTPFQPAMTDAVLPTRAHWATTASLMEVWKHSVLHTSSVPLTILENMFHYWYVNSSSTRVCVCVKLDH